MFTKGPWELHDMEPNTVVTVKKPGVPIADCNSRYTENGENEANATLTAAAPCLFEVLEGAKEFLADPGSAEEMIDLERKIDKALAKARGE